MPENRNKARAVTPDELEAYQRRRHGQGGPDQDPSGLKDIMLEKFNELTLTFRNKAKAIARREIFAMQDQGISHNDMRLQTLDTQFNLIAKGGVKGALAAYKIIKTYAGAPREDLQAPR